MTEKIKELMKKYRELIVYFIVGVLTTIVSWGGCLILEVLMDAEVAWQNAVINTFGWIVGVCFSYPLSRRWVFKSTNPHVLREFFGFAASRLSTWLLDIVIMWLAVNVWSLNYWLAKICISAVIVTILNYVFSKLLIFKKKSGKD